MKHFSIFRIGRLPAASLFFVLLTVFSSCGEDDGNPPTPPAVDGVIGDYIGTLTVASTLTGEITQTPNVKLTVEKVNETTVIVRPILAGATAFRAELSFSGPQMIQFKVINSETLGHRPTGSPTILFEPVPKSLTYAGSTTANGEPRSELFEGNKQ
jgi:hypothetical protein